MARGIVVSEFLEPIFDENQGVALLRYVTDTGEISCIGVEATSLPSLQQAIRTLPWLQCEVPATYGNA
jgi:hypothetical protein